MNPVPEKQTRRKLKRRSGLPIWTGLILLFFLLFIFSHPVYAAQTPVRVGYFANGDFMHKDGDSYGGYDIEYYYTLAGYANWSVELAEFDSLKSALAALEQGDIDVLSGLAKTEERENKFLVAARKMCTSHIAVQIRAGDDRYSAGDTSNMKDLTCGILRESNVEALYSSWCRENGLNVHVEHYDSIEERNAGLLSGRVDAIAGGSTVAGAQKIAEFPALDLYFMFNRNRGDLKAQADKAMSILSLQNPTFESGLFEKYFPSSRNSVPSYSMAEKEFLSAHPVIRVAVLENDAPFSGRKADGTVNGIIPAYFRHLSELIGSSFEFIPYVSKDTACAALSAGEVDVVGKIENDVFDAHKRNLILADAYLKMNLVQITRAGTGAVKSVAVPECNAETVRRILEPAAPDTVIQIYKNSSDSFQSLKTGRVSAVVCTQPAATWLLSRNRATDYVVNAFGPGTWDVTFALNPGEDGNRLRSVMNKAVAVDHGYMSQIITNGTLADSANLASVFDHLSVAMLATIAVIAGLLLFLTAAALIIILGRRSAEKRLAKQEAALAAAEEANKARHSFFGTVSHDMRTPLNGIMGFSELALKSGDPEKMKDYLKKIRSSATVLNGLVNDTLIMSRIQSGKYVLRAEPCDTSGLLAGVLEPAREMAEQKGVVFTDNFSGIRKRQVLADRLSLQKIVLNLLSNAIKFTPKGGTVRLECRLEPADGGRTETVITVSDTGRGISEKFLPHVFEPFAQENPGNADTSGSGLGLSIVKSIVEAMGGTIQVESRPGRGTRFTVRLRLQEVEIPEGEDRNTAAETGTAECLRGKRVLVCEDNALNLEIIRAILTQFGMEVISAGNGKRGVEIFSAEKENYFDAILLDLRMPVMDGMEAARTIRALNRPDAQKIPILAVSADAYPENITECMAAGMNGHVAKPIDPEKLKDTLIENLKDKV